MKPALISTLLLAAISFAQPRIQNGGLVTRSASGGLDPVIRGILASQPTPAWIAYETPAIPGERHMCCWSDCCSGCRLEGNNYTITNRDNPTTAARPIQLEPAKSFYVFLRVDEKAIVKIRTFTPDCDLDAGNVSVYWLTDAAPAQSVAFLSTFVKTITDRDTERLSDSAVSAIAMTQDASAEKALDNFASTSYSESIRRKAVFWLGNSRGRHGYDVLAKIIKEDPSDKVREHAIFALTQNKEPDAMKTIIATARDDRSSRVRGQALFWLGQSAQKQLAADEIARAIDNDPETEVKKRAVQALSQLPDGVPKLIDIAKTNKNAVVRKQAMFWLGQSKDPRALTFFEEVLKK